MSIWMNKLIGFFSKKVIEEAVSVATPALVEKIHEEKKEKLKKALKTHKSTRAKKAKNENA
jgi:hypothetical protein